MPSTLAATAAVESAKLFKPMGSLRAEISASRFHIHTGHDFIYMLDVPFDAPVLIWDVPPDVTHLGSGGGDGTREPLQGDRLAARRARLRDEISQARSYTHVGCNFVSKFRSYTHIGCNSICIQDVPSTIVRLCIHGGHDLAFAAALAVESANLFKPMGSLRAALASATSSRNRDCKYI